MKQSRLGQSWLMVCKLAKAKCAVKEGDVITYELPEEEGLEFSRPRIFTDIIYEDADVAVVQQTSRYGGPSTQLVTRPGTGQCLMYHVKDLSSYQWCGSTRNLSTVSTGFTSGVLMIAKNDKAHNALAAGLRIRNPS